MSASEAQIAANRRNALRSTGPRTLEGRKRSAANAIKHGIYAKTAVLSGEDQQAYDANIQEFIAQLKPTDGIELRIVTRLADADWRLVRARYLEAATLDLQVLETEENADEHFETVDEPTRLAYALQLLEPDQRATFMAVQRHEASLHRQFQRDFKLLADLRKQRQQQSISQNEANSAQPAGALHNAIFENEANSADGPVGQA